MIRQERRKKKSGKVKCHLTHLAGKSTTSSKIKLSPSQDETE